MLQRVVITVAVLGLLAVSAFFLCAHLFKEHAESILRAVYELSQQEQAPTLIDLRDRFGRKLKQMDGCTVSQCGYTVEVSNRLFAAFRIVPYTEIKSYFWVKNGRVDGTLIDYTTKINRRNTVVSHVQIDLCSGCQSFTIHPWGNSSPVDTNGIVEIGKETSAQDIRNVLMFDTRCLSKVGGCESIADLLPTVWRRTPNKQIACRIHSDEGFVAEPANWP